MFSLSVADLPDMCRAHSAKLSRYAISRPELAFSVRDLPGLRLLTSLAGTFLNFRYFRFFGMPNPILLAYATTKGAIQNFTGGLAQMLAEKGIRVNAVARGPIWTPLIPSTMPDEAFTKFGKQVPMKRAGQPAELATAYVMLADPLSSYTSGTTVAVTGGKPFI
jgi:NAD(P)-dependent dehydrogenase (short-subunit alcohol dehydrogenase family)